MAARIAFLLPVAIACCAPGDPPARVEVPPATAPFVVDATPREEPLPPLAPSADAPGGARMRVRRVVEKTDAGCATFEPTLLGACRAIATRMPDATGAPNARSAFDGDRCSVWNAGASAPQAIRARLGAASDPEPLVSAVALVPEMTPNGQTMHVLELGGTKYVVQAALETNETYVVVFDRPIPARSLTVTSIRSPSWIAFREIIPLACEGAPDLTALVEVTPPTPRPREEKPTKQFVRGRGRCATAADCAPASCCHAKTCDAKNVAPACSGVGCSQNVAPGTIDTGECACVNGACGAAILFLPERGGLL